MGDTISSVRKQLARAEEELARVREHRGRHAGPDRVRRELADEERRLTREIDGLRARLQAAALPACPFVAGGMLTDPRLFVGREDELRAIVSRMEGALPVSVNVVGERRIGKSSLLYHLFQTGEQRVRDPARYVLVYASLQDAQVQTEAAFFRAIAGALLERPAVRDQPDLVAALERKPLTRADFSAAADAFHRAGLLPVLCLDEFEALFQHPREFRDDFFDALRALMDRSALMLVLASLRPLDVYRRKHRLTSSFFNLGHTLPLGELAEEAVTALVCLPPGERPALGMREQELAREWGGRHPYLLQLAAFCLCQARQDGRDEDAARRCFDEQARRLPRRWRWPGVRRLLRGVVWDAPAALGRWARRVGETKDQLENWVAGIAIVVAVIVIVILILIGVVGWEQVLEMLPW